MHIFYSRFIDSVFSVCVQGSKEKTPNTMSLGFTSKNLVLKVNFVPFRARSDRASRDFYRSPYRSLISISSLDCSLIFSLFFLDRSSLVSFWNDVDN